MDRTERFYKIDQLLHSRRAVPIREFLCELDVSKATIRRDLDYLRNRLNAPIVWDRGAARLSLRRWRNWAPLRQDKTFTDYEIMHDDLSITIEADELASFYQIGNLFVPDHSPEVSGLKNVSKTRNRNGTI